MRRNWVATVERVCCAPHRLTVATPLSAMVEQSGNGRSSFRSGCGRWCAPGHGPGPLRSAVAAAWTGGLFSAVAALMAVTSSVCMPARAVLEVSPDRPDPRALGERSSGSPLAQRGQPRSDRVVGHWRSTSGLDLTLAYSGLPATFQVQVYRGNTPLHLYEATWIDNSRFHYETEQGERIEGRVLGADRIELLDQAGRRWVWRRL